MEITIREFIYEDIPNKIKWVNDPNNNKYLHYNVPLELKKTEQWFMNNVENKNRYDAIIEVNKQPIGLIGLLNIDDGKKQAEYYITIGERGYHGKGIAYRSSKLLLDYAFNQFGLEKIWLTTEQENQGMQRLARRLGMLEESLILNHSIRNGKSYNAYYYSIAKKDYENKVVFPAKVLSDIQYIEKDLNGNNYYMKRDDLIPFSFGGNKARKASYFFKEILSGNYETVVTYGSKFSNHARVTANLCKKHNIKCIIVSPFGTDNNNLNRTLIELNGAEIVECKINEVAKTIDQLLLKENKQTNDKAYFIPGGGHGNNGTKAYLDAYHEIEIWIRRNNLEFDYIFLASGTGTTQAGLIIGNFLHKKKTEIVGISVARERSYGSEIIMESILNFTREKNIEIEKKDIKINFFDDLVSSDYGISDDKINSVIVNVYNEHGIALSTSYTGKAYVGMKEYVDKYEIKDKNLLFINTGGLPLFFDDLREIKNRKEY